MPKQKKPAVPPLSIIYRKIAISFVVLTVLLVGIIIFFSIANAAVTITPKPELKSAEFLVTVKEGGAGEGIIAGHYEEKTAEEEGEFEATGASQKQGRSEGKVTLVNSGTIVQSLVATTRLLSTEGILFRMKEKATVPAGGHIDADVYADQQGPSGDIGPTKFTIPGLNAAKQKLVYAESNQPMTGGARMVRTVTGDDLEKAKIEVVDKATKKLQDDFSKSSAAVLGGVVVHTDIAEVTQNAKKGDDAQTITTTAKVNAQLLAYDKGALEKIALDKVIANVPSDREITTFHKDAMIVHIKNVNKDTGEVQISVYADADTMINATSPILDPVKISGMLPDEAIKYLKSFDAVQDVQVSLFPSWQKRIPTIPDRIKIVIKK